MLQLLKKHPYLLGFCILTAAFSGPGQTYFISLYIPFLRTELGLTRTEVAGIYSAATLLAAGLVPLIGKLLDRVSSRTVATIMGLGVAAGCAFLGIVHTAAALFAAFAMLRLFGQSGLSITAVTTAAKSFGASRGKALGLTSMGFPLSEMVFPFLATSTMASWGWRNTTFAVAVFVLVAYLPASRFLFARSRKKETVNPDGEGDNDTDSWTLREVLRNPRFYCFLTVMFVPPFMFTGILFHQGTLFSAKSWPAAALPFAFFTFGLFRAILAVGIGPLIDRLSARTLYGAHLLAAMLGFGLLARGTHPAAAAAAFALFGTTVGMGGPIRSALFAEIYGTRNLGAINGMGTSFVIFATAAAPLVFGIALDRGIAFPTLLQWGIGLAFGSYLIGRIGCRRPKRRACL